MLSGAEIVRDPCVSSLINLVVPPLLDRPRSHTLTFRSYCHGATTRWIYRQECVFYRSRFFFDRFEIYEKTGAVARSVKTGAQVADVGAFAWQREREGMSIADGIKSQNDRQPCKFWSAFVAPSGNVHRIKICMFLDQGWLV